MLAEDCPPCAGDTTSVLDGKAEVVEVEAVGGEVCSGGEDVPFVGSEGPEDI